MGDISSFDKMWRPQILSNDEMSPISPSACMKTWSRNFRCLHGHSDDSSFATSTSPSAPIASSISCSKAFKNACWSSFSRSKASSNDFLLLVMESSCSTLSSARDNTSHAVNTTRKNVKCMDLRICIFMGGGLLPQHKSPPRTL